MSTFEASVKQQVNEKEAIQFTQYPQRQTVWNKWSESDTGPAPAILEWYGHCRRQCIEARSADQSARSAEKNFHLHFQLAG